MNMKKRAQELAGVQSLNEGMTGWKHWNDSDSAAGYYNDLEDAYEMAFEDDGYGDDDYKMFNEFFKNWLEDAVGYENPYGTDLGGAESLALITKDKLWKDLMRDPERKKLAKKYAGQAIKKLERELKAMERDLKFNQDDENDEAVEQIQDWIKTGIKPMIKLLRKWA